MSSLPLRVLVKGGGKSFAPPQSPHSSWLPRRAQSTAFPPWDLLEVCREAMGSYGQTPEDAWLGPEGAAHLPPVHAGLTAWVRQLPAHVEKHVVLPRRPFLHEVGREHPSPEDDAVILEAPCEGGEE